MRKSSSNRYYYAFLAAAILWMAFIFIKSGESYQQQSLRPLLESKFSGVELTKQFPKWEFTYDHQKVSWQDPIGFIEFLIRKAGHISEYAVLALLWSLALLVKQVRVFIALLASFVISVLYAASDEWHQTFVGGRTGHAIDVVVDASGALLALLAVLLVLGIRARFRQRRAS
ncbi:VanZ family protein [Paenibacillus sp. N3.4]|uniref:VanZ family protein n=1 Tax=Paenibacillus sp. N3.4 TaxID=2603222 RepID=UPI0011CC185E|nr:VanZ family protein [Paenibacillus sp. N3.4]TXK86109.1 VanZ family protein [Paenibacillus sp. N3.4]